VENCAICGCEVHRSGEYATPTVAGRSHASRHHYVAERFFGRSANRRGDQREPLLLASPWGYEGESAIFCYDCHEELLHNPVLLPGDVSAFAELVKLRDLDEPQKSRDRSKLAARVALFHEVIAVGIETMLECERASSPQLTDAQRGRHQS